MSETPENSTQAQEAQAPPAPDPAVMAAIQAKIAKLLKMLQFLGWGQYLVGILLILMPVTLVSRSCTLTPLETYLFQGIGAFFVALGYAAEFTRKDLTFARLFFRVGAIGQLFLAVITIISILSYKLPPALWLLAVASLVFGGIPAYVIYQFKKGQ
ncbi:MAG: hypothetical protein ACM3PP_09290 [Candidatus Saccharibacteria bacterium]